MSRLNWKSEWVTVGLVALGLLAAETAIRVARSSLSLDIAHLDNAQAVVDDLVASDGLRVLLAGNSLLRSGVDGDALEQALASEMGRPVSVGMVYPDGSNPVEWNFLHRKLLHYRDQSPDVAVLAFGPGHLRDRPPAGTLLRLAAHHVDRRDVLPILKDELPDIEARSQFVLARLSTAYALRDRIAPRVLDMVVPYYRELSPILLGVPGGAAGEAGESTDEATVTPPTSTSDPSYRFLERMLADYQEAGTPVIALPMPSPEPYEVDTGALEIFRQYGAIVVDVPPILALGVDRYPDGEHLDPEGMAIFTDALAPELARALRR